MMDLNRAIGMLTLRLVLGFIFLMQGLGKVFTWGLDNVYASSFAAYEKWLPGWLLSATAYYTSYVELIAGLLLIIGFWRNYALYALSSVLVIVAFGHGLSSPIWPLEHVIFRLMLVVSLLLLPKDWYLFQVELYLSFRKGVP